MFDISWSEFLVIGVVALIVIGPKELPGVLRTLGQYTRKVRRMAGEFQNQFQEAMREAELADLKKEVDSMASDIKNYDPLKDVRSDVEAMGKDIEQSLKAEPVAKPAAADNGPGANDATAAMDAAASVTAVERSALEPPSAEAAKTEPAPETAPSETAERPA